LSPRDGTEAGLRVAMYSGVYVRQDAISHSIRHKLDVLERARSLGHALEWRVFVHGTDSRDPSVRALASVCELVNDPFFWSADLHVFEFGIHYPLFDAVFLARPESAVVGIYHNVTPRGLVDDPATQAAVVRAERQRMNLSRAHHVASDSSFNRDGLLELGFPEQKLSVLHLPPSLDVPHVLSSRRRRPGPLRLLYVGRLVRSKGVLDLLRAMAGLQARGSEASLTVVGNVEMSDPLVLAEIQARLSGGLEGSLTFSGNLDDEGLARLYQEVDALVMPSYHEGYCVPVVEAFAFGCFVVAYDAANLPHVVGDLGVLIPTGDVEGLEASLAVLAQRVSAADQDGTDVVLPARGGDLPRSEWLQRVHEHNARFDRAQFDRGFLKVLHVAAAMTHAGAPDWLVDDAALTGSETR
jgi:glycosyltransferase involved in cell wall biosynthesis